MHKDAQNEFRPVKESTEAAKERVYTPAEHERHYAPLNRELHAADAKQFGWVRENGTVQSYQHSVTHRHIHIDGSTGKFFGQDKNPLSQYDALNHAVGHGKHHAPEPAQVHQAARQERADRGMGLGS